MGFKTQTEERDLFLKKDRRAEKGALGGNFEKKSQSSQEQRHTLEGFF